MGKNVIYMRQSLGLDKQKHSLDMQRTTCLEFATEVSTVIDEIYNEGICSAAKTSIEERPVLNKLLKDAEKGMIDKLFIFKRDRLARNIQQYLSIIKQLQKSKVEVFFTADQEPGIFKGPTGEFIEAILAGLAEQEARNIKKRLILSRKQLARQGKWQCGSPPFGYTSTKGELTQNKEQLIQVAAIYTHFLNYTDEELRNKKLSRLENELMQKVGLKSLNLKRLFSQKIYMGVLEQTLDGETITLNLHETENRTFRLECEFVEESVWKRANQRMVKTFPSQKKEKESKGVEEYYIPLFQDKIFCEKCKKLLKVNPKTYKCDNSSCKPSFHLKVKDLDERVLSQLLEWVKKQGLFEWKTVKEYLEEKMISPIEKYEKELQLKISDCKSQIKSLVLNGDLSNKAIRSLTENFQELCKEIELQENQVFAYRSFITNWDPKILMDNLQLDSLSYLQKEYLGGLMHKVEVTKKEVILYIYKPREVNGLNAIEIEKINC